MTNILQAVSDAITATISDARHSIVQIHNGEDGVGAGTIWHSDGLIVTNAHVILNHRTRRPNPVRVVLDGDEPYSATLLAHDPQRDLAALTIDASDLPTIPLGDSGDLRAGQWVMALGHPWGMIDALTAGVIIGTGDNLPEMAGRDWVALSLQLRPGHSGGPVIDAQGRLVGINTLITGYSTGFAIPVQVVKAFLKETLGGGHEPASQPVEDTRTIAT